MQLPTLVNIPISPDDVLNTIEKLPRTPSEAGLVEVKLKRRFGYKGYHRNEYINPQNIFKALGILKQCGHPDYQQFDDIRQYEERCRINDAENYHLVFDDQEASDDSIMEIEELKVQFVDDSDIDLIQDFEDFEEAYHIKNDPIRKCGFLKIKFSFLISND